jgi:hypothetical protein
MFTDSLILETEEDRRFVTDLFIGRIYSPTARTNFVSDCDPAEDLPD